MKFVDYCGFLQQLEDVSSRNMKTEILARLFQKISKEEVREALYLLDGRITAKYDPTEFNFSLKLLLNAVNIQIQNYPELKTFNVKAEYSELGDIGEFVYKVRNLLGKIEPQKYSILEVHDRLKQIAQSSGKGSQAKKMQIFIELFLGLTSLEAKYLSRIIIGNLRLGMSEKTIIDALSWCKAGDKSLKSIIERAMGVRSDIGLVAEDVISNNPDELKVLLETYTIIPGIPVASKLVEREKGVGGVYTRIPQGFMQPKLDGLRAQVHKWTEAANIKIRIFSRNFEDITHMFPELESAAKLIPVSSFVFDSEVVAYDFNKDKMLPFQDTIQRKRKHGIGDVSKHIPVIAMAFDILYFDGKDYSGMPIEQRLSKLEELNNISVNIKKLETQQFNEQSELEIFFDECLSKGLEGVIVKKSGTIYEAGTRNFDWIKLKASSKKELVDTIDAVVMGYYFGTGARSKFGIGAILIGVYNETEDRYETVAKVGTGITDDQFVTIKKDLLGITLKEKYGKYLINNSLMPDVSVEPAIVVEVEGDELTLSKVHTACMEQLEGKGISMRFPRLKIWGRDKSAEQATTTEELLSIYNLRKKK